MRVMSIDLNGAFARIAEQRDKLNALDDELSAIITQVESALIALKPGVPTEAQYVNGDEQVRWLRFEKHNGAWRIAFLFDDNGKAISLNEAPRHIRAEAFQALPEGPTPLEILILEVAGSIESAIRQRQPFIERARALSKAVEALGYPRP